jgi:hypothetical protein
MLHEHLSSVTNRQVTSLALPGPNLRLCQPTCVLVQLVIGILVGTVNHVVIAHLQRVLLQNVEQLQSSLAVVTCRQAKIHPVTVGVALCLRAVKTPLQGVEYKREQRGSGEADDLVRPACEQVDVLQVVMRNLVRDDQGDLVIGGTTLVKPPLEENVTSRGGEGRDDIQPGNLDQEALGFGAACLQTLRHAPRAVNRPRLCLEVDRLVHLRVEPLSERVAFFKLEVTRHIETH